MKLIEIGISKIGIEINKTKNGLGYFLRYFSRKNKKINKNMKLVKKYPSPNLLATSIIV